MKQTISTKIEPQAEQSKLSTQIRKILGSQAGLYLTTLSLLIAASLFTACSKGQGSKNQKKNRPTKAIPIEVTEIKRGPIERLLMTSRELEAEQEVKVVSRSANRVVQLLVEEGDLVTEGQLLASLEDDIQRTALAKAENQTAKSREEFERQESLHDQKLISDQIFRDARYDLKQLELSVEDAKRELAYTEIRAPISGTITSRLIKLGDEIGNAQHLFNIVDFNSIVARLYVPEKELSSLKLNQEVRVTATAYPEQKFKAHVLRISPIIEANSGMIKVTIAFKEIGPLRPGMYVDAGIVVETKPNAVLIPKRALAYDGDQQFVFRLIEDRKVERLRLEPGLEDPYWLESPQQVKEGDQIVIAGQTGLKDASTVRLPGDPEPVEEKEEKEGWFAGLFGNKKD